VVGWPHSLLTKGKVYQKPAGSGMGAKCAEAADTARSNCWDKGRQTEEALVSVLWGLRARTTPHNLPARRSGVLSSNVRGTVRRGSGNPL